MTNSTEQFKLFKNFSDASKRETISHLNIQKRMNEYFFSNGTKISKEIINWAGVASVGTT